MRSSIAPLFALLCAGLVAAQPARAQPSHLASPDLVHATGASPSRSSARAPDGDARPPVGLSGWLYLGAGYGYSGALFADRDRHHQASTRLSGGLRLNRWFSLGLTLDGRYDRHTGLAPPPDPNEPAPPEDGPDSPDSDDGYVGDPRAWVALQLPLGGGLRAGAHLGLWFPGASAPSLVPAATTLDALALLAYAPTDQGLHLGLSGGFRLDRSAESATDANLLSRADRLSLGVSDANAALLGASARYRTGGLDLIAALRWDVLIGADAPALATSPLRATVGARLALSPRFSLQLALESNLARLPTAAQEQPLSPYYPRFATSLGLLVQLGAGTRPASPPAAAEPAPAPAPAAPTTAAPTPASLTGRIAGAGGIAVDSAQITVATSAGRETIVTDSEGRFRLPALAPGRATVTVDADGFVTAEQTVELTAGQEAMLAIDLEPALPAGQLRGQVRSFRGRPLEAEITVQPLDQTVAADADGRFEIDVAPGAYRVIVSAPGFRTQRRSVEVEDGEVVILNIDLRRGRRR